MSKAIQIYNDEGVSVSTLNALCSSLSDFPLQMIDSAQVRNSDWEDTTSLFIMPGGRDVPYHEKLKGRGNEKIRRFVESGGAYLGICGGGYYGASSIEFDKGAPLEFIGTRELNFFPYQAIGPASGIGTYRYNSEYGARASLIQYRSQKLHVYFNGGSYFPLPEKNSYVKILAHYEEISQPAILQCKVGEGTAILSGVHFEVSYQEFPLSCSKLKKLLLDSEEKRKKMFYEIIHNLTGLHGRNQTQSRTG